MCPPNVEQFSFCFGPPSNIRNITIFQRIKRKVKSQWVHDFNQENSAVETGNLTEVQITTVLRQWIDRIV